jgi:hypothetical protein
MPGAQVQAVLAPAGGQPAWAATAGSGTLRSTNGSGGWSDASTGLGSHWVTSLWRDPSAAGTLLAGTDDGLYQRSGTGNWSAAAFPQQDPWIQALATAPGGAVLAGTYDGDVLRRSGGGWASLAHGLPSVLSVLAVPADHGGGVLVGSFDGAYCLGCNASLGATSAPASSRPGTTLPPRGARPGASSAASASHPAGATPSSVDQSPDAGIAGVAGGAGSSGSGGSGGMPRTVWYVAAGLIALSALLTGWGVRRSSRRE